MLDIRLRVCLIIAVVIYFINIIIRLKKKSLTLKYSLLWIFAGVVMLLLVCFPALLLKAANLVGIKEEMNGLYIFASIFGVMLLLSLTTIVTSLHNKTKTLIQEIAILEKRVRELENRDS